MADGRHLENRYDVITHNSAADEMWRADGNRMLMTMKKSKSKPEVEF